MAKKRPTKRADSKTLTKEGCRTMADELWKVTNIADVNTLINGSGSVPAKRITFKVIDGTTSAVIIPDSDFGAERVREAIQERAEQIVAVAALTGPTLPPLA